MLVEIHILQNHSPSNLNRDDTGSPKECMFGGFRRARISSQCLKRTIRRSEAFREAMEGSLATRTRRLPELVRKRLIEAGIAPEVAEVAARKASGFGTKEGKERAANAATNEYETAQTMFITVADVEAVYQVLLEACKAAGSAKKLGEMKAADLQAKAQPQGFRPITADVALFGRMTTSEALRDVEASAQVAHAISTHKVDHEFDYFTAVDDLQGESADEEDAGADMIGDVEFNSACYYKYMSIDVDGLCDNLMGVGLGAGAITDTDRKTARSTAGDAVVALLRAAVTTTPTGKQNTFAAHQLPAAVLVEVRPRKAPVSYANAFVDPARPSRDRGLVSDSLEKLARHVEAMTDGFELQATARLLLAPVHPAAEIKGVRRVSTLGELCAAIAGAL